MVVLRPLVPWAGTIPAACLQEFIPSEGIKFWTLGPQEAGFYFRTQGVFSPGAHLCSILLPSGLVEMCLLIIDNLLDF